MQKNFVLLDQALQNREGIFVMKKYQKKKRVSEEHLEQIQVIQWAREMEAGGILPDIDLLYAVPNGDLRNVAVGARLKSEGVRAGVPDLCLPVPRGGFSALYIEMKTEIGTVSPKQQAYISRLVQVGNMVVVCRSHESAKEIILEYLLGKHKKE